MTAVWVAVAGVVAVGAAAWWLHRRFLVVTVNGESMTPTYAHGDRVLARRARLAGVRAGDVVVAAAGLPLPGGPRPLTIEAAEPGTPTTCPPWMIKRVVAVPGDTVPEQTLAVLAVAPGHLVPPGRFVAYGDNVQASADSRQMGYFYEENLLGVVVARLRRPDHHDDAR